MIWRSNPVISVEIEALFNELQAHFGAKPRRNEPLSGHTTSRLGGPADIWLPVTTLDELIQAVGLARQYQAPVFMLGSGANLLIQEGGIRGLVIENRTKRVWDKPAHSGDPMRTLVAESGVILPNLARRCAQMGLSGFEWAIGVPGTVGGAVTNNAGAYGSNIAAVLVQAELLSAEGERVWKPVNWFQYDYRMSRLKDAPALTGRKTASTWIVLQVEFRLAAAPREEVWNRMNLYNQRRKSSQPTGATMGSMFKNPPGDHAGRLIDAAGLKGHQIGQAQISELHGNFFQSLEGATAADMVALIKLVQETVEAKFGVKLELEVEVIGESEA
jgi:UDP-N-acetylmuramate dehydrogenase